jgi:L-Ala-D/L-Glu epimerase
MQMTLSRSDWEFITPLRIAYRQRTHAQTVRVELRQGEMVGRGEALGVSYRGESAESILEQLESVRSALSNGMTRSDLLDLLPRGGARNAVDCALWDLEAKRCGRRVWELIGLQAVRPLVTAYTLGIDTPDAMSRAAANVPQYSILKMKLGGHGDLERIARVRRARPDAQLILDANQSWSEEQLYELAPRLAQLGVTLLEQPLPVDRDRALESFTAPVALCADESCQAIESLPNVEGKYAYINIKLDKTGGLTAALELAHRARARGLKLMVGCMGGSSLSMAPAFVVGQFCDVVDLDGPLLSKSDVPDGIRYEGSRMSAPDARLWG